MKRTLIALSVSTALLGAAALQSTGATAAPAFTKCGGSFTVMHNDRIGSVPFPAGPYAMTARSVSCQQASNLFRGFLQDWDGRLPGGWSVSISGNVRTFRKAGSTQAFTATPQTKPTPAPSPIPTPSSLTCPGSFQVLHNDRVGAMILPKGSYRITRLTSSSLSCAESSRWFAYFLNNSYAGNLPKPWTENAKTNTFYDGSASNGFRVQRISSVGSVLGWYPGTGEDTCTTSYRVADGASYGSLYVPAGSYDLTAIGSATCSEAVAAANRIFSQGFLPANWVVNADTGTFRRRGTDFGFRLDPHAFAGSFTG